MVNIWFWPYFEGRYHQASGPLDLIHLCSSFILYNLGCIFSNCPWLSKWAQSVWSALRLHRKNSFPFFPTARHVNRGLYCRLILLLLRKLKLLSKFFISISHSWWKFISCMFFQQKYILIIFFCIQKSRSRVSSFICFFDAEMMTPDVFLRLVIYIYGGKSYCMKQFL